MYAQELHNRQIVVETNWKLDYIDIDSEDIELTEDLFHAVQWAVRHDSLILSITRIS